MTITEQIEIYQARRKIAQIHRDEFGEAMQAIKDVVVKSGKMACLRLDVCDAEVRVRVIANSRELIMPLDTLLELTDELRKLL